MTGMRIAAIVVTHNRLSELEQNVSALRAQTRPLDSIIVVDNASTDGTGAWLDAEPGLDTVHQPNRGPGDAIGTGLRLMVDKGFDWGWCLDDDAIPEPQALEMLCRGIDARPDARVFNSLGLAKNDPEHFAIGALCVRTEPQDYLNGRNVASVAALAPCADANRIVDSIGGHFWLGPLIHRSVVQEIGVPYEWLFIRGDEVEYGLRIMRAGYHILMVTDSHVFHPAMPTVTVRLLGKARKFKTPSIDKWYYALRNGVWIRRVYYDRSPLLPYVARRLGGALLVELFVAPDKTLRGRLGSARTLVRGVVDGMRLPLSLDTMRQ